MAVHPAPTASAATEDGLAVRQHATNVVVPKPEFFILLCFLSGAEEKVEVFFEVDSRRVNRP